MPAFTVDLSPLVANVTAIMLRYAKFFGLLLILIYATERLHRYAASFGSNTPQDPIVPPYFVPFLGHALQLSLSPEKYICWLWTKFGGMPVRIITPGRQIYFAMPGEQVLALFKSSHILPTPSLYDALTTFFGLPRDDVRIFQNKLPSDKLTGLESKCSDPSRQIMLLQRQDFAQFLHGKNLRSIIGRFSKNLELELNNCTGTWTSEPDLYSFVLTRVFRAEVEALYGERILSVCPSLVQDFWAFYDAMPTIAKKLPRWLFPSAYSTQQKMQDNFSKWHARCTEQLDIGSIDADSDYEPVWGTKYVRRMVSRYEGLGFSDKGVATVMLGFLFVTVANSIPVSLWMLLHILLDDNLVARIQPDIDAAFGDKLSNQLDVGNIKSSLLDSIYYETLRLHVGGSIGRTSSSEYDLLGCWRIRPGVPVMSAHWLGSSDDSFWNTGLMRGQRPEHPLDTFWAERFLEYPDDPMSGPFRKPEYLRHSRPFVPEPARDRDRVAKLVSTGFKGRWFPFGGGASKCPGEALAKQTIYTTVAMVMKNLDIQTLDPLGAMKTKSKHKTIPFGSHGFDRNVPVWIRQRVPPDIPPSPGPPPNTPLPPLPKECTEQPQILILDFDDK